MLNKSDFETTYHGHPISLFTMRNSSGLVASVTNFGARLAELWIPDRNRHLDDVVLGYTTIDQYITNHGERFLGAICGRYANRIAGGHLVVGDKVCQLSQNDNGNTLHGGFCGLDSVVWSVVEADDKHVHLSYISPDGEEGFPGTLAIEVTYMLSEDNALEITYRATTDQPTPVNLTHHSFFNLRGEGNGDINSHILTIRASRYLPVDKALIPTGEMASVEGTPMDFRQPTAIGHRLKDGCKQLSLAGGYDHCWLVDNWRPHQMQLAASVEDLYSGRRIDVMTDQPAMQFYGGNFFDGTTVSKDEKSTYAYRGSLALETQCCPDAPHNPQFGSTILNPQEAYSHRCIYRFSTID